MAYVKRTAIKTTLNKSLDYITNPKKTNDNILISANNCFIKSELTYKKMQETKKNFSKTDGILGIHFMQSFKPNEIQDLDMAHEIGKKWGDKFLKEHEYILATHIDKDHIHNHIICNSVNYVNGKKYLKNDKELQSIRDYSDEVLKEYGLSIIEPNKKNRSKSYKEWKSSKENISWKDKIKIDINETIKEVKTYEEFIEKMKEKGYELKYGNVKYNSFKHKDMGRATRGKTIGYDYTEESIKKRIKNLEYARKTLDEKDNFQISPQYKTKKYSNNKYKYIHSIDFKYRQNTIYNYRYQQNKENREENRKDSRIEQLIEKYKISNIQELVEKEKAINKAVTMKKEEYNKRVKLMKNYETIFNNYLENKDTEEIKDIKEFKEKIVEQKKMMETNYSEYEKYLNMEKEISYLTHIYKDKIKEKEVKKLKER